jgi:predicted nucleic-acid-binding Zn-ribbon protein
MRKIASCPNCGGGNQYLSKEVSAGGGHAPNYLPGLGSAFRAEKFHLVLCADCGLTRFFARESALSKVRDASAWQRT